MRYLFLFLLFLSILSSCKTPKVLSDQSHTNTDITVRVREYRLNTDYKTTVDTTSLTVLQRGKTITRKDKKTGITTSTRIQDDKVITHVEVEPTSHTVTLTDTTKTITNDRTIVQQERYNLWDKLNDLINLGFWLLVIFFAVSLLFRILK